MAQSRDSFPWLYVVLYPWQPNLIAILLPIVLWVLCMNNVGLRSDSPFSTISIRNFSLFSSIPLDVAVIMASGISISAIFNALNDDSVAAFRSFPIRLASIGEITSFESFSCSTSSITHSATISTDEGLEVRGEGLEVRDFLLLIISEESFPPNPKALHITLSTWQPVCPFDGTIPPCSGVVQPRLEGMKLCSIASRQITSSIAPDADVVCPVYAFVLEMSGRSLPNTFFIATLSVKSLFGVPVP